jgi:gamma-glutamyltranspeptidase/glutathione hydrolase
MITKRGIWPALAWVSVIIAASTALGASHPPVSASNGMVAADVDTASAVGVETLQAGGNAADAAVTTALALGVLHPFASGMGGGGFALYYDRESDEVVVFDFRERAPAAASRDMYLRDGEVQSGLSLWTGLAVGVPGEIAGLWAIHQRFGQLPWGDVVAPAIRLADEGFPVSHRLASVLEAQRPRLLERPALAAIFLTDDGDFVSEGEWMQRPGLAETLRRIAAEGPEAFYSGPIADQIVESSAETGGVLTLEDLAAYVVAERSPITGRYRGYTLYSMPPPSSGGVTMIEILNVLEAFDLRAMGHNSSEYIHHLAEAMQFGFADRAAYLGDSDFVDIPIGALLEPTLGAHRSEMIQPDRTLEHDRYGADLAAPPDDSGTSHFSIVDSDRNMIALTTTINTTFGSAITVGDTGIILNNEMDDFSAQPGVPNAYGLVGAEANAIAPGKRPLSSMSPTLVFRDGSPYMTLGGSGGPRIITATLQTFLNVVEFDMHVAAAVDSTRVHHQWLPDRLLVEEGIARDVVDNLIAREHPIDTSPHIGAIQAIVIDGPGLFAGCDPRKGGIPRGY